MESYPALLMTAKRSKTLLLLLIPAVLSGVFFITSDSNPAKPDRSSKNKEGNLTVQRPAPAPLPMNKFPFHRLKIKQASIGASLDCDHLSPDAIPWVTWHICIEIEPMEVTGGNTIDPEIPEKVTSAIMLDGLDFASGDWLKLSRSYEFNDDQNGSFYVSSVHNPVDVLKLSISSEGTNKFTVDATIRFHFEFEMSGFRDESVRLVFPARFEGLKFVPPDWKNVRWTEEKVLSFCPETHRFKELSAAHF